MYDNSAIELYNRKGLQSLENMERYNVLLVKHVSDYCIVLFHRLQGQNLFRT